MSVKSFAKIRPAPASKPHFRFSQLLQLWRERQQLAGLSAEQLDDIGISRNEADLEAQKPIWDAPEFWHD